MLNYGDKLIFLKILNHTQPLAESIQALNYLPHLMNYRSACESLGDVYISKLKLRNDFNLIVKPDFISCFVSSLLQELRFASLKHLLALRAVQVWFCWLDDWDAVCLRWWSFSVMSWSWSGQKATRPVAGEFSWLNWVIYLGCVEANGSAPALLSIYHYQLLCGGQNSMLDNSTDPLSIKESMIFLEIDTLL